MLVQVATRRNHADAVKTDFLVHLPDQLRWEITYGKLTPLRHSKSFVESIEATCPSAGASNKHKIVMFFVL